MEFGFTEEQEMLRTSAREFLEKECPWKVVRDLQNSREGYSRETWRKMVDLGWTGLVFPEQHGGSGGTFMDLALLLEEMGRVLLPSPFTSTVLGGLAILEGGTAEQKQALLPELVKGGLILALALAEPGAVYGSAPINVKATGKGNRYSVNGVKLFVREAHIADRILCPARTASDEEGVSLFLIDSKSPGVQVTPLKTIGRDRQSEVLFEGATVPEENILGPLHKGWPLIQRIVQRATLAECLEMLGAAQKVLDMTVEHAKTRVQFGRPIGSFQAIQHKCADMLIDIDTTRLLTYYAAWKMSEGLPGEIDISRAKASVSEASRRVMREGHQVLAGTGFIIEHPMHLYFNRAKAGELMFGTPDDHRKVIASGLLAQG